MLDSLQKRHDTTLAIARAAMLVGSDMGFPLSRWRDFARKLIEAEGLPQPDDLLAWVSEGKGSDAQIPNWDQKFGVR